MRREISRILLNGFMCILILCVSLTTRRSILDQSIILDIMMMNDDAVEQGYNNLLISKMSSEFIEI